MATWSEFAAAAPALADSGARLLRRGNVLEALLATVSGDTPPRVHPIWVAILDGRLVAFLLRSPKREDLARDGRYALHAHVDASHPEEFEVRGRAHAVTDTAQRASIAARWYFEADETYDCFEFEIETALLGRRETADDWPPVYTSWRAGAGA